MTRAKALFMQTPISKYKNGFKLDHVWHIVKNSVNLKDNVPTARNGSRQHVNVTESSQSDNLTPDSSASES